MPTPITTTTPPARRPTGLGVFFNLLHITMLSYRIFKNNIIPSGPDALRNRLQEVLETIDFLLVTGWRMYWGVNNELRFYHSHIKTVNSIVRLIQAINMEDDLVANADFDEDEDLDDD